MACGEIAKGSCRYVKPAGNLCTSWPAVCIVPFHPSAHVKLGEPGINCAPLTWPGMVHNMQLAFTQETYLSWELLSECSVSGMEGNLMSCWASSLDLQ